MFTNQIRSILLAILLIGIHPIKTSAITAEEAIQLIRDIDNCRKNIDNIFRPFQSKPTVSQSPRSTSSSPDNLPAGDADETPIPIVVAPQTK